jgi:hypothetical protein
MLNIRWIFVSIQKFNKSSRAMKPMGSVKTVLKIWNKRSNAHVAAIVTDEDSTTRDKLSNSMAKGVTAGTITEAEQGYKPKTSGHLGLKKTEDGELPLEHPEIDKLLGPIHYVKNYKANSITLYLWPNPKVKPAKQRQ